MKGLEKGVWVGWVKVMLVELMKGMVYELV